MRAAVWRLVELGRLPSELEVSDEDLERRQALVEAIDGNATDAEALAIAPLLGNDDDLYGLAESLSAFVQSAPSWPIWKAIAISQPRWRGMWAAIARESGHDVPDAADGWIDEWVRLLER